MNEPRQPVRPAAVHFDAPTSEPLVFAALITQDPESSEFRLYARTGAGYQPPDPHLLALLVQSVELANLVERDHP